MGVRGLRAFIDANPRLVKTHNLCNTRVVVDGCKLGHCLYHGEKIDCMFGGEYPKYADEIKKFFTALRQCNIEPIVVFDGGWDPRDRLFHKKHRKQRQRLENVINYIQGKKTAGSNLPINSYSVYKDVLRELGIRSVQCDYEGDNQMASLANFLKCPLISDDSDFYIYDLTHGFIRISHLQSNVIEQSDQQCYLKCRIYFRDSFMQFYNLQNERILHLYAVMVGNDNSSYDFFPNQPFSYKKPSFLSGYDFEAAMNRILPTEEGKRDEAKHYIEMCIKDYQLKPTGLKSMISKKLEITDDLVVNTNIKTLCGAKLPAQFVVSFHEGLISSLLLNVITLHRRFLQPQVEDFSTSSSYCCSRYIRQVTYGILLQHDSEDRAKHAEACLKNILEYDREGKGIQVNNVPYLTKLRSGKPVPGLSQVYSDLKKHERQQFLADLLGVPKNFFSKISPHLKLMFGCLVFWLCNCDPKPAKQIVDALLIGMVLLGAKEKQPLMSDEQTSKWNEGLRKYCRVPTFNADLDCQLLHYLCQLQACIVDTVSLNSLLGSPLQTPKLQNLLSGHLFYNLSKELEQQSNAKTFVQSLLGDQEPTFKTYKNRLLKNIGFELI